MRCVEGCGGEISMERKVNLRIGCGGCGPSLGTAFPCIKCGRLHWDDGSGVFNRQKQKAYLRDGEIINE